MQKGMKILMEYMLCPHCRNFVPLKLERSKCPDCRKEITEQSVLGKPALETITFEGRLPDAEQCARLSEGTWNQQTASGSEKERIEKLRKLEMMAWISLPLSMVVTGGLYVLMVNSFNSISEEVMKIPVPIIRILILIFLLCVPLIPLIGAFEALKIARKHIKAMTVTDARCKKPEECVELLLYGTGLLAGQQPMNSPLIMPIPQKKAVPYAASLAMRMVPADWAEHLEVAKLTEAYNKLYVMVQDMIKQAYSHFVGVPALNLLGDESTVDKSVSITSNNSKPFGDPKFETEYLDTNTAQVMMTCPCVPVRGFFMQYDSELQRSIPEGSILLSRFEVKVKATCIRRGDHWFLYDPILVGISTKSAIAERRN